MTVRENLVGQDFGKLTVMEYHGVSKHGKAKWKCKCSCGNELVVVAGSLKSGNTVSCGCFKIEKSKTYLLTHGLSKRTEYSNWSDMLRRCFNENNNCYEDYALRGISVHQDFIKDFPAWLKEIGDKPSDGQRWSVGRIDNNGWYTYGNMRWEVDSQQARNHSKQKNNTSGITGVQFRVTANGTTFVATWVTLDGKRHTKEFSEKRFGYEPAKQMAIDHRNNMIAELNAQGAEYAESHGSDK